MQKAKHKYPIGTEVKFKFFDGSIHVGAVIKQTYQGESWGHIDTDYNQPLYTIQVPDYHDTRGFMLYPAVGPHRILESNGITNKDYIYSKKQAVKVKAKTIKPKETSNLEDAIQKQKDFINRKTKNC
tara:strand:+ start:47 stop:427 length:381 start_codon:yes stop_codon:yes gene_type:complete